jgi:ubiquinol-cytochrome c reductase subunit 6
MRTIYPPLVAFLRWQLSIDDITVDMVVDKNCEEVATAPNGGDRKKPFNYLLTSPHTGCSLSSTSTMSLSSFFSSFLPTTYADAAPAPDQSKESKEDELKERASETPKDESSDDKEEDSSEGEEGKDEPAEEEEEEEEPEDVRRNMSSYPNPLLMITHVQVLPGLREQCEQSAKCAPLTKHFQHCQEKVEAGEGFQHENCIEEL